MMDSVQEALIRAKRTALESAVYSPALLTPANQTLGRPLIVTPNPFPNYPAPGAAAVEIIRYQVPRGMRAVLNKLAIVHVGGGFVDGSGNVIWRVLVNGAGVKGMEALTSQVGSYSQPNDTWLVLEENDLVQVTVEVPAAQPAMPPGTTTAARVHGFATALQGVAL